MSLVCVCDPTIDFALLYNSPGAGRFLDLLQLHNSNAVPDLQILSAQPMCPNTN